MSEVEKMKFKAKFDKFLTRTDKIEMQLKQVFSKYFGQVNDDMRGTLKEDPDFERAHNAKDAIALWKMLKSINYNYKKSEEPIKTMYQATKDLILMKQYKKDIALSLWALSVQSRKAAALVVEAGTKPCEQDPTVLVTQYADAKETVLESRHGVGK